MTINCDVAVVGGGALALAIARELRDADATITLIRPARSSRSATLAAGAMQGAFGEVTADNASSPVTDFCIATQTGFENWVGLVAQEAGAPVHITKGTFIVSSAGSAEDNANLKAIEAKLSEKKEPYQRVSPGDVPGYSPHSSVAPGPALFIEREGTVEPRQLITALTAVLMASGNVSILDDTAEQVQETADGKYRVITSHSSDVIAEKLIVAAGVHTMSLVAHLLPSDYSALRTFAGQGSALEMDNVTGAVHTVRTPNRGTACGLHVVPLSGGRVYVGATNRARHVLATGTGAPAEDVHQLLEGLIHEIGTYYSKAPLREVHFGLRPVTADNQPIIGETGREGLLLATGTHRTGILMSPRIAELVAADALGKTPAAHPFRITSQRLRNIRERDNTDLVRTAIPSALDEYLKPDGHLPYDRREGLIHLFTTMYDLAVGKNKAESERILNTIQHYPAFAALSLYNSSEKADRPTHP
ncbi:NAD(P)/FAD-dependent oxidoreductase [Streptomyces sp. NPDC085932]|uniref:NAD(P)/FAD-dependent oxidoreductase n=1 Tax=Streptomyces sp. NPDC085932 TaxID=3365741 RepID=UPI0037D333EF